MKRPFALLAGSLLAVALIPAAAAQATTARPANGGPNGSEYACNTAGQCFWFDTQAGNSRHGVLWTYSSTSGKTFSKYNEDFSLDTLDRTSGTNECLFLDVNAGNIFDETNCSEGAGDDTYTYPSFSGGVEIKVDGSGKCLTSTSAGAAIADYTCDGGSRQIWSWSN